MSDDTPTSEDDGAPGVFVFAAVLLAIVALVYVTQPLVTGLLGVDVVGDSTDAPFTNDTPAPTGVASETRERSADSVERVGTLSPTAGSGVGTGSTDARTTADTDGTATPHTTRVRSPTVTTPLTTTSPTPEPTSPDETSVTTRTATATATPTTVTDSTTPTTTATPTTVTTSTTPTATESATATQNTTAPETRTETTETPQPTTVSSPTSTRTPSPTPEPTTSTTGVTTDGQTDSGPAIETFAVDERSPDGTTLVTVDWRVVDPDSDLASVRVTLVVDPDAEARRVEQQRFDADGDSSLGSTTLALPAGVDVYEVRLEAMDETGNSVFALTREVADDTDG